MSNGVDLELVCPNGHNLSVSFNQEEFEAALRSGQMKFHCNTCDTDWTPTAEEIGEFRKLSAKDPV